MQITEYNTNCTVVRYNQVISCLMYQSHVAVTDQSTTITVTQSKGGDFLISSNLAYLMNLQCIDVH